MMYGGPPPYVNDFYPPRRPEPRGVVGSALDDTHKNPNKVFAGGLKPGISSDTLRQYMQKFGRVVDAAIVTDKYTGASRGFGFVSFANEDCVNKCMDEVHYIQGTKIDVRRAVPSSEMPSRRDDGNVVDDTKVFVGGLPVDFSEAQLREFCEAFGAVKGVSLRLDINNRSRGFGFVSFEDAESAKRAVGQHELMNQKIEIKKATPQQPNSNLKGNAYGRYGRAGDFRPPNAAAASVGYGTPRGDAYGYGGPGYGQGGYGFPQPSYGSPPAYDSRYGYPPRDYGGAPARDYSPSPNYGGFNESSSGGYGGPRMGNGYGNYDVPQRAARYGGGPRTHPY